MRPRIVARSRVVVSKSAGFAFALAAACLASTTPLAAVESSPRSWTAKVLLTAVGQEGSAAAPALCSARLDEGSSDLALLCRHELGTDGEIALVLAGSGARSEPPFWSAPLASPFESVASLSEDAMAKLLAGELALRIEVRGLTVEGGIGTPIFDDGFDTFSVCNWSNFPCSSDGNACTDEVCSSTGVCSHPPNTLPCSLPGASGGCFLGGCIIQSCNNGYSNCDVTNANGCEVNHNGGPGSCASIADFVGSYSGDTVCGFICPSNFDSAQSFATRTGLGEMFFEAEAIEQSTCDGGLEHRIDLVVPDGVDFDLYVYRNCQLVDSSTNPTGVDEVVSVTDPDDLILTDDFFYQVEIKWFSGRSCEEWTLTFTGYQCS